MRALDDLLDMPIGGDVEQTLGDLNRVRELERDPGSWEDELPSSPIAVQSRGKLRRSRPQSRDRSGPRMCGEPGCRVCDALVKAGAL